MAKIKVNELSLIFGGKKNQAFQLMEKGLDKNEILKKTGCTVAVNKASFEIHEGEIFVIMGLSGSGKSTLLRCFNRLINPTRGNIILHGEDVAKVSKDRLLEIRRKSMSMVFQHFGLLPHRTVISNVGFGLELQGAPQEERDQKAMEAIKTVGLEGYENMMTGELSGGMQQRVGLARALANNPEILLMDEAFSALDPLIRSNMQDELIDIQRKLEKTILFITHDLDEALKLGDRIAIMKDGMIVQIGTPEEILTEPADDYVKAFVENVDRSNIVTASSVMFKNPAHVEIDRDGPAVALRRMREKGQSHLPVVDKNHVFKGFVQDDEVALLAKNDVKKLDEVIHSDVPSIGLDSPVVDLLPLFIENKFSIPVLDENWKLKGIVAHASIIAEVMRKQPEEIMQLKEEGGLGYEEN
jgi:glycine betaine/proline transport system ATP-binding protein